MSTRGFIGYKHNGVIKGYYNHHDSYPEGLGSTLIKEVYCKYTWPEIKDFFLHRLNLLNEEKWEEYKRVSADNGGVKKPKLDTTDLKTTCITVKDESEFLKDGLFCEYSYVFDLDSKRKKLMCFKGFGEKPSKGYEHLYYESNQKDRLYNNYMGCIYGELHPIIAYGKMIVAFKKDDEKEGVEPVWKTVRRMLKAPQEDLPLYLNHPYEIVCEIASNLLKGAKNGK